MNLGYQAMSRVRVNVCGNARGMIYMAMGENCKVLCDVLFLERS
jgi:hypothetical protein